MDNSTDFNTQLFAALDERQEAYDSVEMSRILEHYREFHSVLGNLISVLIRKAVIKSDPYKHEKKISGISIIPDTPFTEQDKPMVIGTRLSDFESILDFICNYYKFSLTALTTDKIKQLVLFNNCFAWNNVSMTSSKPNTKALAEMINGIKQSGDTLTTSVIMDCLAHISRTTNEISNKLKEVISFQRELYKGNVRRSILLSPYFDSANASTPADAKTQIKKLFSKAMEKTPFYDELIEEVLQEDFAPNKNELRTELLTRISIHKQSSKQKETKINMKELLMTALRVLAATAPQLEQLGRKIEDNQKFLESLNTSFSFKFMQTVKKMLGVQEKPVEYKVTISENITGSKRVDTIVYQRLMNDLMNRVKTYSNFTVKTSPAYQKLESMSEQQVLEYLTKQLSECQRLSIQLAALDTYFKNAAQNSPKIRGFKMELSTIKSTLQKTNQCRVDYTSQIEEQAQMAKLGVQDA